MATIRIQRRFEDVLGELIQQPVRAHQLDALLLGLSQELFGQLLLIHLGRCHGIQCFGHHRSFPPSWARRVEPRTGSTVIQTVPEAKPNTVYLE